MKVLLIVPRCANPKQTYREYPLGVGLIATALRQRGHEAVVYDQAAEGGDDDEVLRRAREYAPDVAGFSVITPGYPAARRQIARLKSELPGVLLAAGGVHANLFPADLLADGVDLVLLGEGQSAVTALVDRLAGGRPWHDLPGAVYRSPQGDVLRTALDGRAHRGGDVGIVDRDVFNLARYSHHSMLASLGCPHQCTFCCNYSGTVLHNGVLVRPVERIIAEMRYLADRYGARQVFFADDVFLLHRGNILEFCRRLSAERLAMQWIAQMRVDAVDRVVAHEMAAAGCRRVYFGVESGSEAILRRVRKGIDREAIRLGVRSAKEAGLRVKTGWIFGLPGTLPEQYETIPFLREIRPHEISIHQLVPFPGTEFYRRPAEYGLRIRDPKDFESFCYGGLGDNVSFDYLSRAQLLELLERAAELLEADGYVCSDRAAPDDEYVYSTPLQATSMSVFRAGD
jgi:anaerobic magnesium-protoporphyrin IX monomethyl ester cyclase